VYASRDPRLCRDHHVVVRHRSRGNEFAATNREGLGSRQTTVAGWLTATVTVTGVSKPVGAALAALKIGISFHAKDLCYQGPVDVRMSRDDSWSLPRAATRRAAGPEGIAGPPRARPGPDGGVKLVRIPAPGC